MKLLPLEARESWILCSVLGFIALTGVSLNITQLIIIYRIKEPRHGRLYQLVASLSLAGLLTSLVMVPVWLYILLCYQIEKPSENFQKIHEIFYYSFDTFHGVVSFLHLVAVAGERALAISSPITHIAIKDIHSYSICTCCWFLAAVLSSTGTLVYCFLSPKILVLIVILSLFFLPFVLMSILCVFIGMKSTWHQSLLTRTQRRERRAASVVVAVFACFCITCLPFQVLHIVDFFYPHLQLLRSTIIVSLRCVYYSSSLFTPLIQLLGVSEFRGKLSWCAFKCCARNERSQNDLYTLDIPGIQGNVSARGRRPCDLVRHTSFYHNTNPEINMVAADQYLTQTVKKNEDEGTNFSLYSSSSFKSDRYM